MPGEQIPQEKGSWLQRHKLQVAAVAVGLVALFAPDLGHDSFDGTSEHPAVTSGASLNTKPMLVSEESDRQVYRHTRSTFEHDGYAATVTPPSVDDKRFYFNDYLLESGGLPGSSSPIPKLEESAYILDDKALPAKTNDVYGFGIFNSTKEPLRIPFIRFSLEFMKSWVDQRPEGVTISDVITAHVGFRDADFHSVFLVPELPSHPASGTDAYTERGGNSMYSWVDYAGTGISNDPDKYIFGPNRIYLHDSALGTELCQSMMKVSDPKVLLGGQTGLEALEQETDAFARKRDNLRLVAQEKVCNSLGRAMTAFWLHGANGIDRLVTADQRTAGLEGTPHFDYTLATSSIGIMAAIKDRVEANPGNLYTLAGSNTPTIQANH